MFIGRNVSQTACYLKDERLFFINMVLIVFIFDIATQMLRSFVSGRGLDVAIHLYLYIFISNKLVNIFIFICWCEHGQSLSSFTGGSLAYIILLFGRILWHVPCSQESLYHPHTLGQLISPGVFINKTTGWLDCIHHVLMTPSLLRRSNHTHIGMETMIGNYIWPITGQVGWEFGAEIFSVFPPLSLPRHFLINLHRGSTVYFK